ncbi:MAG: metallophosphoesterase family protein [bacterium]|nr:metallophosphoesterase family protein [bacterium]
METRIAGTIGPAVCITEADVDAVLSCPIVIGQDSEFRGKVSTRLFANDRHVLKLKSGFALAEKSAQRWCQIQLERERLFGIYPPHRHWVVLVQPEGCAVANISLRGITLEATLTEPGISTDTEVVTALMSGFFACYFTFWKRHGLRQDEGLTNYIVESGHIYYIDDDIYSHDNMLSFAHSLCGILRRLDYLDKAQVAAIAQHLRAELLVIGSMMPAVLAEQLRDVFLPPDGAVLRHEIISVLEQSGERSHAGCHDRVAILADIHGNLPALQAVLASMKEQGLEHAIVLGDIVGYGPFPGECVDLLSTRPWIFLRGNHDHAAAMGEAGPGFSFAARWSTPWTVSVLSAGQRQWLGQLPLIWREDGLCAVHGAPVDPTFFNGYVYAGTSERNLDAMVEKNMFLCFHGHSHMAGCFHRNRTGMDERLSTTTISIDSKSRYLICPGSVGQPRDGCLAAQYAIYDKRKNSVEFKRVDYDRKPLGMAIVQHGFPEFIARQFQIEPVDQGEWT